MTIRTIYAEENTETEREFRARPYSEDSTVTKPKRKIDSQTSSRNLKTSKERDYQETVTFLLHVPKEIWMKFVRTVPISRTRHDFVVDLIQRRIWEYEKATETV